MPSPRAWVSTCDSYADITQFGFANAPWKFGDDLASSYGPRWNSKVDCREELQESILTLQDTKS